MEYFLGMSVHIRDDKILFIGGLTGTQCNNKEDDIMTVCSAITLTKIIKRSIIPY